MLLQSVRQIGFGAGDVEGMPVALDGEAIECRLLMADQEIPFRDCSRTTKMNSNPDGRFTFEARTRDPRGHNLEGQNTHSHTVVHFSIDSTAPVISFLERPDEYHGDSDVMLQFKSNENVSRYECSMTPSTRTKRFNQCPGNDPGTVDYHLDDGWYTFQAKGQDLAGNSGYSEEITFNIDSLPPQICKAIHRPRPTPVLRCSSLQCFGRRRSLPPTRGMCSSNSKSRTKDPVSSRRTTRVIC